MSKKTRKPRVKDSPVSRMDDACYSHDPLTQYLNRSRYHETYLADVAASSALRRKIAEEEAT